MKDKKTFSKAKLVVIICSIACLATIFTICAASNLFTNSKKDGTDDIIIDGTTVAENNVSGGTPLFTFDTRECAQKMINAFNEGKITEVRILYDQSGANMPVVSKNPKVIEKAYNSAQKIVILGDSNMSITDSYHYIYFVMDDGTSCGYSFEGDNILVYEGDSDKLGEYKNYSVKGTNDIWALYWELVE